MIGPAVMKMMKKEMMILCVPPVTLHCRLSGNGGQWLTPCLTSMLMTFLLFSKRSQEFQPASAVVIATLVTTSAVALNQ